MTALAAIVSLVMLAGAPVKDPDAEIVENLELLERLELLDHFEVLTAPAPSGAPEAPLLEPPPEPPPPSPAKPPAT